MSYRGGFGGARGTKRKNDGDQGGADKHKRLNTSNIGQGSRPSYTAADKKYRYARFFDGEVNHGYDRFSTASKANGLRKTRGLIVLTSSSNAAPPYVVGHTVENDDLVAGPLTTHFQTLQHSQDPGVAITLASVEGPSESELLHADREIWQFQVRRENMILPEDGKILREIVAWNDAAAGREQDIEEEDKEREAKKKEDELTRQMRGFDILVSEQILAILGKWKIQGGKMNEYLPIVEKMVSNCVMKTSKKAFVLATFSYKPETPPVCIAKQAPRNGKTPPLILDLIEKFKSYDQVTVAYERAGGEKDDLLYHLDSVFEKCQEFGPFWFLRSKWDRQLSKWQKLPEGVTQITPEAPSGDMFSKFLKPTLTLEPPNEPWMRKTNFSYGAHELPKSFCDMKQFEYYYNLAMIHDLGCEDRMYQKHFTGNAEHRMQVFMVPRGRYVRLDIYLDRSLGDVPKMQAGREVTIKLARPNATVFQWSGLITDAYSNSSDADLVVEGRIDQNGPAGRLQPGTEHQVFLWTSVNPEVWRRHLASLRDVLRAGNPFIEAFLLNQRPDQEIPALKKKTDGPGFEPVTPPIDPDKPLDAVRQQAIDNFTQSRPPLNIPQQEIKDRVLKGNKGFYLLQGPPGNGKSICLTATGYECYAHGGRVLMAASSNGAVDNLSDAMVSSYADHVPESMKGPEDLVILQKIETLKLEWRRVSNSNSDEIISEMMSLLGARETAQHLPQNDPKKREHYLIASHINRWVRRVMANTKHQHHATVAKWTNIFDKLNYGTETSQVDLNFFNSWTLTMLVMILKNAKIVISTSSTLTAPIYKEAAGHFNIIMEDDAGFSTPGDTLTLMGISFDAYFMVGDHNQQRLVVNSTHGNPYHPIIQKSIFAIHQEMNYRMQPQIADYATERTRSLLAALGDPADADGMEMI